jgi:Xaa-Pro aminopeptidase
MASLVRVPVPSLIVGTPPPPIGPDEYRERIGSVQQRFGDVGIDILVVYGDRESFGDLHFLTGADPRFEEAIYILGPTGQGTMLLGNENLTQWSLDEVGVSLRLYQALSPVGQRRDSPVKLGDLLRSAGIEPGVRVGIAGAKPIGDGRYLDDPDQRFGEPSYLVDTVRSLVGDAGGIVSAHRLFDDPATGLRTTSSAHQIAVFEYAASIVSRSVISALGRLAVGMSEADLADELTDRGLPHSCHTMVSFGPEQGLSSPTGRRAELGDAAMVAQGVRGGLTCRAGAIAASESDLPPAVREIFPELAANYFDVIATWHESVRVGTTSGAVFDAVDRARKGFDFSLNPGHFLHLEEWSQSTFRPGDDTVLQSGSLLQCDIIPVVPTRNVYCNIEDGIVLADVRLRDELADDYPELFDRAMLRRDYAAEHLGVKLDESILPLSNGAIWHAPYLLDRELALAR